MTMYRMFIGGTWVDAADGQTFEDRNPYNGELFGDVAAGKLTDVRKSIEVAQQAFSGWSATSPAERRQIVLRAAEVLESKREQLVGNLIDETGSTFGMAMFQSFYTPTILREAAARVSEPKGEFLASDTPGVMSFVQRQPVGVVAGISPWNAPLILSMRAICLPIALGNTVVLKPAPDSPVSGGVALAEIFEEAGLPPGVLNVVTHSSQDTSEIGDELVSNPYVKRLSFTGSTRAGRGLAEKCGRHLKRIALELGGHNPLLILDDADIGQAVDIAAFGAFLHQGQICMSVRRIIVARAVAEEFTSRFVSKAQSLKLGNPREHDTVIGPLINQSQLERVKANVDATLAAGARALCGAKHDGLCYYPTVLVDVTPQSKVGCDETFGPVVALLPVDSIDEALAVANQTNYGLSSAVLTKDYEKGLWLAERLETGMVHINDSTVLDEPQAPFGGVKQSGLGRLGGRQALDEFTEAKWITIQRQPRTYPF
ncbi:MAG TPA: aldehyde dehydrogenase family protein [Polyangiaceae bacterium]|nr:aldehyde dehydrogenase family protein [Polyangiaceae bacterium]